MRQRNKRLHVIEVHAREYAGEETITTKVIVWSGRDAKGAQDSCDRLNRRRSGGLDERYPIRYEVQDCPGESCCSREWLARMGIE